MDDPDVDVATLCDRCSAPIAYGRRCYAVARGELAEDGYPFVDFVCHSCKEADS